MRTVRAKFTCHTIDVNDEHEGIKTVRFSAVTDGSEENKDFTKYTPWGEVEMGIDGEVPAADFFEVGKEYYLDFTKAKK